MASGPNLTRCCHLLLKDSALHNLTLELRAHLMPRWLVETKYGLEKVYPNIIYWDELDKGGRFAAFEQPALFTQEIHDCFRGVCGA
jgi:hypothetical protein